MMLKIVLQLVQAGGASFEVNLERTLVRYLA
jgi:hypothetical protein